MLYGMLCGILTIKSAREKKVLFIKKIKRIRNKTEEHRGKEGEI